MRFPFRLEEGVVDRADARGVHRGPVGPRGGRRRASLAQGAREVLEADDAPGRSERDRRLERGEELAHVAGPGPARRAAEASRVSVAREPKAHVHETDEVAGALAERRQLELEAGEAEIEIGPERGCFGHLLERPVRRREHAQVHAPDGGLAEPPHLVLLEDAQELALQRERQVADLVEKERSPGGFLDETLAVPIGPRECPARVAEQLRFRERPRKSGDVHGDEGPAPPREPVELLRQDLLARAALAEKEHRDRRPRDARRLFEDLSRGGVFRHDRKSRRRRRRPRGFGRRSVLERSA